MQHAPSNKKKPVVGQTTGYSKVVFFPAEQAQDSRKALNLQALRIRRRFPISWPVARLIASHAYGEGAR